MSGTRTFAILTVSQAAYDEIAQQLRAAGYVVGNDGERSDIILGDFAVRAGEYGKPRRGRLTSFDAQQGFVGFNLDTTADVVGIFLGLGATIIFED